MKNRMTPIERRRADDFLLRLPDDIVELYRVRQMMASLAFCHIGSSPL